MCVCVCVCVSVSVFVCERYHVYAYMCVCVAYFLVYVRRLVELFEYLHFLFDSAQSSVVLSRNESVH